MSSTGGNPSKRIRRYPSYEPSDSEDEQEVDDVERARNIVSELNSVPKRGEPLEHIDYDTKTKTEELEKLLWSIWNRLDDKEKNKEHLFEDVVFDYRGDIGAIRVFETVFPGTIKSHFSTENNSSPERSPVQHLDEAPPLVRRTNRSARALNLEFGKLAM